MVKTPYFDKNGIKKGAWSEEEDQRLAAYIEKYGHPNWRQLPKFAGLARCGKSCRLRWMNYLRPNLKRGKYTQKEEQLIMDLHKEHGNKWSLIANKLPGRTDNEIKNYWHSHLRKFLQHNEIETYVESKPKPTSEVDTADSYNILESSLSSETSYTEDRNSPSFSSASWDTFDGFSSSFWTEPFILENAFGEGYFPIPSYGAERDEPFIIW